MTVHLDGPKSIMGIWWLHIMVKSTEFVCIDAHGSKEDKDGALLYPVEGVWHAQSVPSEQALTSEEKEA